MSAKSQAKWGEKGFAKSDASIDVSVNFCGIKLRNPLVLASGIVDTTASSLIFAIENCAGAVTCKSISLEPRKGHGSPIIVTNESGMLNAVGLSNPGLNSSIEEIKDAKKRLSQHKNKELRNAAIIGNVFATSIEDFAKAAKEISKSGCEMLELNLSCPNVKDEFGEPFACNPILAAELTKAVKKALKEVEKETEKNLKMPILVKLAPNVPDIAKIAKAVEAAGADGITAINTMPGMMLDLKTGKPILTNKSGGFSGPNLKPIAVKCIYDIYKSVKIPILGTGGVTTGKDAIELMMAGASAVGVGTAVYYRGIDCFKKINDEIVEWMKENNISSLKEIIGKAHR
ncbi:TPA: dihydroorotate dehydrogenase [Candidatus Woesearchaeota archaeon]|nr:dihydroorotate dehydrogenase [Candidatus Woesearchaeota archaeon]